MSKYIELEFISPISEYNFKNYHIDNILVITGTSENGFPTVRMLNKLNLDNVDVETRAYPIAKTIRVDTRRELPNFCIKLFQYNNVTKVLTLLFSGNFDSYKPSYGRNHIILKSVPKRALKIIGKVDKTDFLWEPFNNFKCGEGKQQCLLFFKESRITKLPLIDYELLHANLQENTYVFNRYTKTFFKELTPFPISRCDTWIKRYFNRNNTYNSYIVKNYKGEDGVKKLIKNYQIDLTQSDINQSDLVTVDKFSRRKMDPQSRPIHLDAYKNNVCIMPIDGRVLGFDLLTHQSKIVQNNYIKLMSTIFRNNQELKDFSQGSGFLIRTTPHDHHHLTLPYEGNITEISRFSKNGFKTVLRVENNYYIAPQIPERDQFSVVYGKCLRGNRGCKTRLAPQQDTKMVYYIVIMGSPTFKFNDQTLEKINKNMKVPNRIQIKSKMYTPKNIVGTLGVGEYLIAVLSNRQIRFENDILHNSRMEDLQMKDLPVETYVKYGSRIGESF
ncbi:MAG: hypothetical protein CMF62_01820 [Magnetococcales bacterium]|nr:hypothetical protein [Magnetococcales bacterium]|tara:strand:+ start:91802 stop:93304 length:1503 start_codon:yes stop_codon:yes gene_type:complete